MTEIKVFKEGEKFTRIVCDGHTGYGVQGEDIVCSAISAVTQTAVLGITELVKCPAAFEMQDGELCLILDASISECKWQQAELILGTMLLGLSSIQEEYSDYLKLIEREV